MTDQYTEPEMALISKLIGIDVDFDDTYPGAFKATDPASEPFILEKIAQGVVPSGERTPEGDQWFKLNAKADEMVRERA